jgi:hypothetical protein
MPPTFVIHGTRPKYDINRSLEEVDSNPVDDFEGFKTSVEGVTQMWRKQLENYE